MKNLKNKVDGNTYKIMIFPTSNSNVPAPCNLNVHWGTSSQRALMYMLGIERRREGKEKKEFVCVCVEFLSFTFSSLEFFC